jgi:Putative beta-barrel porin 2
MRRFAIPGVVAAALLAAPAAAAQDATRDPLEASQIRFGAVGITPVLVLRDIGRDNNVFNESTNPKSDFTATISPKLDVLVHPGPVLLTVTTTTDYVYFQTYKSERGTNVGSTVRADFSFGPIKPYVSAGGSNSKDRINREIDARARHRDRSYGAGVRVQIYEGLFASAGARQSTTMFDEDETFRGESLAAALNNRIEALDATAGVALTPLTTVSVLVSQQRDRFDLDPVRDSDTFRVMPTVTFSPLAILNGSASFGYRRFTMLSGAAPDYRGFVASLTLGATVHEHHRIETTLNRDLQYSYDEATPYYLETGAQASWSWQVAGPFDVRLAGSRSRLHYQSDALTAATDEDATYMYGGGANYRLREHLRVGVNAECRQRSSERGGDREFDNRKIYATVTWGKQ